MEIKRVRGGRKVVVNGEDATIDISSWRQVRKTAEGVHENAMAGDSDDTVHRVRTARGGSVRLRAVDNSIEISLIPKGHRMPIAAEVIAPQTLIDS